MKNNIGSDERMMNDEVDVKKIIMYGIIGVIALIFLVGGWFIVPAGNKGVLLTLGKVDQVAQLNGFHFKMPLLQKVVYMDVQTQKYEAKASAASSDLQTVSTDIAVNYHLSEDVVVKLYTDIGVDYGSRIIQPAVQEVVKSATAHYTAEQLITKRASVKDEIDTALSEKLIQRGIIMETTSITNFDFSAQFNAAIEQKVTQEQQALTAKNRLAQVEYEAQQVVAAANGQRDAAIATAEAQAKTKLLNAESEAKALELQKAQITSEMLELRKVEVQMELAKHWNGAYPQYYMTGGNGVVPVLDIPTMAAIVK